MLLTFKILPKIEPHLQNFEISKFKLFAPKIQKCFILLFWHLRHYLGPKVQERPLSPEFVPNTWPAQGAPDFAIRCLKVIWRAKYHLLKMFFCSSNHMKNPFTENKEQLSDPLYFKLTFLCSGKEQQLLHRQLQYQSRVGSGLLSEICNDTNIKKANTTLNVFIYSG